MARVRACGIGGIAGYVARLPGRKSITVGTVKFLGTAKFSPWPVVLLLLASAAYFLPQTMPSDVAYHTPALRDPLSGDSRSLFNRVRPAAVEVEQMGEAHGDYVRYGIGTGVVIEGGKILTAYHVVDGAKVLRIKTLAGATFPAKLEAFDNAADIALLSTTARNLNSLPLAPREPQVGEQVLAVGNSGGDFLQARTGRLLRLGARARQADFPQNTLEMSAALAPGDSGGPIVNAQGQVMGIVSYIRVNEKGQTLTSYAVPVSQGSPLVASLLSGEKKDVPAVGLAFDAEHEGNPPGGVVAQVAVGGPAAQAGVQAARYDSQGQMVSAGDIITAVNGIRTRSANDVMFEIRRRKVGDLVTLTLNHAGSSRQVTLSLVAKASIDYDR